jgi:hypothetical protein
LAENWKVAAITRMVWNSAIGAGIIPNGRFPSTRLRALDPFQPDMACSLKVRSAAYISR